MCVVAGEVGEASWRRAGGVVEVGGREVAPPGGIGLRVLEDMPIIQAGMPTWSMLVRAAWSVTGEVGDGAADGLSELVGDVCEGDCLGSGQGVDLAVVAVSGSVRTCAASVAMSRASIIPR